MLVRRTDVRVMARVVVAFALTTCAVLPADSAGLRNGSLHLPMLRRPADFDQFWQSSLTRLAEWPMQVQVSGENLSYRGMYGKVCTGVYRVPAGCQISQAVIHIMAHGDIARRTPRNDGVAHLSLYWYPPDRAQQWTPEGLPDRQAYLLREAVVDVCQAINALLSRPEVVSDQVGITGEGIGAVVAMAVAALDPDRVDFAVIDRPWPACHYNQGGPRRTPPEVAAALADLEARYPQWQRAIRATTTYFDLINFAGIVKAPVLMLEDHQQHPKASGGPRKIPPPTWLGGAAPNAFAPVNNKRPFEQPVTWEQAWLQWAREVKGLTARNNAGRGGPAWLGAPQAAPALPVSTDELFVTAEPVRLSW